MMERETLVALLERLEKATGRDAFLELDIHWFLDCFGGSSSGRYREHAGVRQWDVCDGDWRFWNGFNAPNTMYSLDAARALVTRILPGWWIKSGTCCVSDDACIAPDFNCPTHGPRLRAQFDPLVAGSEFDVGFDVDRRPSGNEPIAILEALVRALIAIHDRSAG